MSHRTFARLRALTLLVALCIGFLGQMVASAAMAMPMQMPQEATVSNGSTMDPGGCPACPWQHDGIATTATSASGCTILAFCSSPPAVLPTGPIVARVTSASFQRVAFPTAMGIAVRPDLGPPRSIRS